MGALRHVTPNIHVLLRAQLRGSWHLLRIREINIDANTIIFIWWINIEQEGEGLKVPVQCKKINEL